MNYDVDAFGTVSGARLPPACRRPYHTVNCGAHSGRRRLAEFTHWYFYKLNLFIFYTQVTRMVTKRGLKTMGQSHSAELGSERSINEERRYEELRNTRLQDFGLD